MRYKKDALKLLEEVKRQGGKAILEKSKWILKPTPIGVGFSFYPIHQEIIMIWTQNMGNK
jgi:hypothetical protein